MFPPVKPEHLAELKTFIDLCTVNPAILHQPEFAFVKFFIEHFGGSVPKDTSNESPSKKPESTVEASESKQEKQDVTGGTEPDVDTPQKMGDLTIEPTEENVMEAVAKRSEAVSAFAEKNYEKAIKLYTEAIELNPQVALVYAKRGQTYLFLEKPHACIRDCDRALELNPDSAAAHKFRGRAYQLLGKFKEAAKDLRLACKFDFDEQSNEWLREVTPMAREIEMCNIAEEHATPVNAENEKQGSSKDSKENEKQGSSKDSKENEKQGSSKDSKENSRFSQTESNRAAPGLGDFSTFLNDTDILQTLMDPEMTEAFSDICANPMNILKYQSNPKIMTLLNTVGLKFGGAGGMPGAKGAPTTTPKSELQDDDDFD